MMNHVKLFEDYSSSSKDLNRIVYGNTTKEKHEIGQSDNPIKKWFIDNGVFDKIVKECPLNDSETTRNEIGVLLSKMKNATEEEITFARYVEDESNMAQAYIDFLDSKGVKETMGGFFGIDSQTEPLLFHLKEVINRPRPYQLAYELKLPLFPLIHSNANTAAYPSGHSLAAHVMSEYYSQKHPELRAELEALGTKVANSREIIGVHYPSDTTISKEICKIIFDNNLLTTSY
jgi:acid phosphatase (class A)